MGQHQYGYQGGVEPVNSGDFYVYSKLCIAGRYDQIFSDFYDLLNLAQTHARHLLQLKILASRSVV